MAKSLFGVINGAVIIFIAKFFWLEVCVSVADIFDTLELNTCLSFENLFFYLGIASIILGIIGFLWPK
jgi:hypothetical protein